MSAKRPNRTSRTRDVRTGDAFDSIATCFTTETGGDEVNGNYGMAGLKFSNWEGGVRIPLIVRRPEHVEARSVSDAFVAGYDLTPTQANLIGVQMPDDKDGARLLPALHGRPEDAPPHRPILCSSYLGPAMVNLGGLVSTSEL